MNDLTPNADMTPHEIAKWLARRSTGPTWQVRELVRERDKERCARCGVSIHGLPWSLHHRRNRASGGTSDPAINSPANLLLLCGSGTTLCHGDVTSHPADAIAAGLSVSVNARVEPGVKVDLASVPVEHKVHGRVLLDHDGGWRPA